MITGAAMPHAPPSGRPSRLLSFAQLVRLPNVFTAMADMALAALATTSLWDQLWPFFCLILASSSLYCAGMVWNDYFDYDQDSRERPQRPLPSHRIARSTAARLGGLLLAAGVVFAALSGIRGDGFRLNPLVLGLALAGAILLYDWRLKRTPLGPVGMGLCRFLNVLMGLTIAAEGVPIWGILLATVVGVYITGVTWFARREAVVGKQNELAAASLVVLFGLALALLLPVFAGQQARSEEPPSPFVFTFAEIGHVLFPYLLVGFGFWIGIPAAKAIRHPWPQNVQKTVKRAVLGLIVLDTILAMALAGTIGLLILALLPPAVLLGKRLYST